MQTGNDRQNLHVPGGGGGGCFYFTSTATTLLVLAATCTSQAEEAEELCVGQLHARGSEDDIEDGHNHDARVEPVGSSRIKGLEP